MPSVLDSSIIAPYPLCGVDHDQYSVSGTIAPSEFTQINGRVFPVLFKNSSRKRIILDWPVFIDSHRYMALIDTGATISAVNPSFLFKISPTVFRKKKVEPFSINLSVDENNQYVVEEQVEIILTVDSHEFLWCFYLVNDLSNDIVLGMDWLSTMHVNITCHDQVIHIGRKIPIPNLPLDLSTIKIPESECDPEMNFIALDDSDYFSDYSDLKSTLPSDHEPSQTLHSIRIRKSVTLPPFSFTKIKLQANKKLNTDVLFVPQYNTDTIRQIAYGSSIISIKDGIASTFVLNLNNKPVRLRENLRVGTCRPFSDNDIICDVDQVDNENSNSSSPEFLSKLEEGKCNDFEKIQKYFKFGENLSSDEHAQLLQILKHYSNSFSSPELPKMGKCPFVQHSIDVGDAKPIKQRPYRVSFKEREILNEQVDRMLENNLIEYSNSPWSSPVVLVKKPNGGIRFCVDYRKLNQVTRKDSYPLPRIDDALDKLRGAKYFTTLDCDQAYYQIEMEESSKDKTAFITPDGLYNFRVLPFGLSNSPASFQRLIDSVLGRLKWTIALVYMDDVIVFSKTFSEHINHIETILSAIARAGLILQSSKCSFGFNKLKYLGHIISSDGVEVDPEKVRAIKDFPVPKKPRDVQSFVATCSYYRRFIPYFSRVAKPLHDITKKGITFNWDCRAQNAFEKLKSLLCTAPILGYPDETSNTEIHCDGSGLGLGCSLVQIQNGEERVVAYASRTLRRHEQNYSATDLECLAVLFSIQKFRPYLYGRSFKIITDHKALCDLINFKDPHGRAARWSMALQPYDFVIVHRSGRKHADADGLSRNPVEDEKQVPDIFTKSNDVDDLCHATDQKLFSLCAAQVDTFGNLQYEDPRIKPIIDALLASQKGERVKIKNIDSYKLEADILYKARFDPIGRLWRLVVPESLHKDLLTEIHSKDASHLGLNKTWRLVEERYYWPKMFRTVCNFVRSCKICQVFNRRNGPSPGTLQPDPPPKTPFSRIGIDFVGPFPVTWPRRNTSVLTIIDHLSRYVEAYPCKGETTASAIDILKHKIFLRHSIPKVIIADKGSCFVSHEFKKFCADQSIKLRFCTTAHPETNAVCERSHDVFQRTMAKIVAKEKEWDKFVDQTVYSYNITHHKVINMSPFFALFGRNPRLSSDNNFPIDESYVNDGDVSAVHKRIKESAEIAYLNTVEAQKASKILFDKRHPSLNLKPGDLVAIKISQKIPGKVQKWQKRWIAPFKVLEQIGPITYKLIDQRAHSQRPLHGKDIRIVSTRELKRWYNDFGDNEMLTSDSSDDGSDQDSNFVPSSVTTMISPDRSKYAKSPSMVYSPLSSVHSSPSSLHNNSVRKNVNSSSTTSVDSPSSNNSFKSADSSPNSNVSITINGGSVNFSSSLVPPLPDSNSPSFLLPSVPTPSVNFSNLNHSPTTSTSGVQHQPLSSQREITPTSSTESEIESDSSSTTLRRSSRVRKDVSRYNPSSYWQPRKKSK